MGVEASLVEDAKHLRTHRACCTDQNQPSHLPSSSGPSELNARICPVAVSGCFSLIRYSSERRNLSCIALTASWTSVARTTHETRIDDVEMISMLIPLSASTSNMSAATPGWVFIPAPINDTLAIS